MRRIATTIAALFLVVTVELSPAAADPAVENKWNVLTWNEIKPIDKENWRILGWNALAWNTGRSSLEPASENKSWSELTDKEQIAAEKLGYDEMCWDG